MQRLDPKLDLVFKLLLTREQELLRDMLEGILAKPVLDVAILDPGIPGSLASGKQIVLDVRAQLGDGSRADVEMQIRVSPPLRSRLVYYCARDYVDQLDRGDAYHLLTPTAVIVWLVEPLFPTFERLQSTFELRERHTHTLFGDQLAIHLLQLSALSPSRPTGYAARVERWARFLTATSDAELDCLAAEDRIMTLAKQTLDALSEDPAARRLARERDDEKLDKLEILASRLEGITEGMAKGRATLLLKQLGLRFGTISAAAQARVEHATLDELDTWAERVLTASTLDDVLAPSNQH